MTPFLESDRVSVQECVVCGEEDSSLIALDSGGVSCSPCHPWIDHIDHGGEIDSILIQLGHLGYSDTSSIRDLARAIHSQESRTTRSLGFCELFLPWRGPEHDRHWIQFLQKMCVKNGLPLDPLPRARSILIGAEIDAILDLVEALGVRNPPQSERLREILALFVGGDFGQHAKDTIVARILQWNTPRRFFTDTDALSRSFRLLKQTIQRQLDPERVWFTDQGIIVIGTSGKTFEIVPHPNRPRYRVIMSDTGATACLHPRPRNLPFGDTLVGMVMALYNDEASADLVPVLKILLPETSSGGESSPDSRCAECNRVMIDSDRTPNPTIAPQSSADPSRCKTCVAGNKLPEGANQPTRRQPDPAPENSPWGRGMSAEFLDRRWSFIERYRNRFWDEWEEEE